MIRDTTSGNATLNAIYKISDDITELQDGMSRVAESTIREHWNQRAQLGQTAGTQDLIAKELEHKALLDAARTMKPHTILEVGCGRGELARLIVAHLSGVDYLAVDNSPAMIGAAKAQPRNGRLRYACRGVEDLPKGYFDCVITERMLINLPTWEAQKAAIDAIAERLHPGGYYLMCENSQDGLNVINFSRGEIGLPPIAAPWHNRYLLDAELSGVTSLTLVDCQRFSSTYYFLSRVVNAALAQQAGQEPTYDAPVNRLALRLPAYGPYAQNRLWIWRKPAQSLP